MCVCVQLGRTPLHCAAAGGHSFVIDTLLTAGAALELTDKVSCYSVKKGKVFPYSLPSVGPGADPGVQAVSPQVT